MNRFRKFTNVSKKLRESVVRPFGDISYSGAAIKATKRKARRIITEGLLESFNSW